MSFYNIARCLSLLALTHKIIATNTSNNGFIDDETRQSRVTGRIVKLYSGSRPEPILCTEEGFKSDPNDCSIFYRCVSSGRGKFTVLRFNCGPGTVYDPDIEVCNHPRSTRRAECNGGILYNPITEKSFPSQENEIDSELEPPSPIDFVTQFNSQRTTKRHSPATTTTKQQKILPISQATTIKSVQLQTTPKRSDDICVTDGFVGDAENCRTFYRCVANGRGGFIKYEFSCSESTMWDDDVQGCNHAWAIKRRRCGRDSYVNEKNEALKIYNEETIPTTVRVKYNYGNKNIPKDTNKNYQQKISTMKPEPKTERYTSTKKHVKENVFVNNRQSYGSETEDDDIENNDDSSTTTTKATATSSTAISSTTVINNNKPSYQDTCTSSGFMGDSKDCRKFYRCVDNGKGGYTKFEFTCGEGTVWDSSIEACNHAWAVEKCGGSSTTSATQTSTTTTESIENTQSTTEPNDYDDSGYNNPQTSTKKPVTSVEPDNNTNQDSSTSTASPDNNNSNECVTSGFMGDKKDCKKFYRCVDDGKGGFIKYEFTCGEGTVWDSEIESCNHESAVKKCNQKAPTNSSTTEASTTQKSTTEKLPGTEETPGTSTTTTTQATQTSTSYSGQDCTKEGFMGDRSDCKKFYRCVDNGNGGFIKYEFSCGEGTVWDSEIQSCNHPNPNKKCGTAEQQNAQNPQENQNDESDNVTEASQVSTTTTERSSSTTKKQTPNNDKCDNEGFYGDSNDCKKFYRCVDNGNGGYTKYDFACGEGTIWDQEIQGCNHASSNSKCKGSQSVTNPSNNSTTENQQTTSNTIETESTEKSPSESSSSSTNNDECNSEGFFANTKDCKKFYRCVSDSKGGYSKYDFSCGEGTIWVQEIQACDHDNDLSSCATSNSNTQTDSSTSSYSSTASAPSQSPTPEREDDEYTEDNSSSNKPSNGKCTSEGYYPDENDCRKFYRCVDNGNGGYTKYDFTCGEGTAWDSDLQTCNHENEVQSCKESNQSQPPPKEEESQTTQKTTTTRSDSSSTTSSSTSSNNSGTGEGSSSGCKSSDKCEKEGYFGNSQDCTKFYRCVENGHGGLTKYDFDCGEGTIWDQDVQTCNHPGDVQNPSCNENGDNNNNCGNGESNGGDDSATSSTTSQSPSQGSSTESNAGTSDSTQSSSNCTEDSSEKPKNNSISCPKAGFYANPNDCKKFYRCVDWDGDGQRYSVFHFDCGEGTIWDPELETCNYEESVYPPRDCSGTQSVSESESSSTSTQESTTKENEETTTTEKSTTESTTTEQTTTEKSTTTTQETTTSEQITTTTTTEKSTTEEETTTTEKSTTEQSTTEKTTTEQSTTEESTTKQSTTEESTTEQSTTEKSTTEQSTTEQSTTEQSTTEQSTTEQSTTEESTTEQSTTEQSTTEESTTEESTTEQSTTEESTTEQSTTEESTTEQSTTEESTTEQSSTTEDSSTESSSSNKDCPETEDDQYLYVCPTGFKRHPKYCNLFYQCTEDDDTHEVKVAVFNCPNNTIYDENKNQCVEESEADKKCDGEMAERRRFKRLDTEHKKTPIVVSTDKRTCKSPGHYPFEKNDECSPAFMKCVKSKTGIIRSYVYRCPEKHVYWSISRRCEPMSKVRHCKNIDKSWSKRWEIPYETKNIAP